jgi:PPOX class probable F420-dependent enzyme
MMPGMSRRELIKMTPDEVEAFLDGPRTMNLATHNPDGSIHLVAMWYGFTADGTIGFETFHKSQKVQNLRRDARVTALVEAGDAYENLQGVELVGTMEISDDHDTLFGIALSVLERYHPEVSESDRNAAAEMVINKRVALLFHPEKTVTWDHRKLAGGY